MSDYIKRTDAVRVLAIVLCAEAQTHGYNVSVSDCIPEAEAWFEDYCPVEGENDSQDEGEAPAIDCPGL